MIAPAERGSRERRMAVGAVMAAGLLAPSVLPLRVGDLPIPWPLAALWAAYGWSVGGAQWLPAALLFALGLWHDLLAGGPWGAWALVYLVCYAAGLAQRRLIPPPPDHVLIGPMVAMAPVALTAGFFGTLLAQMATPGASVSLDYFAAIAITLVLSPLAARFYLFDEDEEIEL